MMQAYRCCDLLPLMVESPSLLRPPSLPLLCPQVCTGVMLHGYGLVKPLCQQLQAFMQRHGFKSLAEFKG